MEKKQGESLKKKPIRCRMGFWLSAVLPWSGPVDPYQRETRLDVEQEVGL